MKNQLPIRCLRQSRDILIVEFVNGLAFYSVNHWFKISTYFRDTHANVGLTIRLRFSCKVFFSRLGCVTGE